jgi:hypothetical protein
MDGKENGEMTSRWLLAKWDARMRGIWNWLRIVRKGVDLEGVVCSFTVNCK